MKYSAETFGLFCASVLSGVIGQLAVKNASRSFPSVHSIVQDPLELLTFLKNLYLWIWIVFASLSAVTWIGVVKQVPLSLAYPVTMTVSFLLVIVASNFLFGEHLTTIQWVGIVSMVIGVWLAVS